MMKIFSKEDILHNQPFRVFFKGEKGFDTGGLSREAFSTFWELAYLKHFDGNCLLAPVVSGSIQNHPLQVLGHILSCGYVFWGFNPIRISFPSLLCVLRNDQSNICGEILLDAFKNTLNPVDAVVIKEAFACKSDSFAQDLLTKLISVFSRFDCLEVPKPSNLLHLCEESARSVQVYNKAVCSITEIAKGVPMQHRRFWNDYTIQGLYRVFVALSASSTKVTDSIKEPLIVSPAEQRVFGYLTQLVG